jgi:hypothetical protein
MLEQNARSEILQHFSKPISSATAEPTFAASRNECCRMFPTSQASRVDVAANNPSDAFLEIF